MKKKWLVLFGTAALCTTAVTGCGGKSVSYADGTYEGRSAEYISEDEDADDGENGYGVVNITIKNNAVTECTFKTYELDGTLKEGEDYGKEGGAIANRDYYNKAQKAIAACDEYAAALVKSGSLDGVDAISGATINYESFKEAVKDALKQAENQQ